ncbi:MAG: hypothetical protein WA001_04060 [Patescibacteria group bacterium]
MNIDRQELIRFLSHNGTNPHIIQPAMQLVEPVFRMLESGFDFSPGAQLSRREVKDAIQSGNGGGSCNIRRVWFVSLSKGSGRSDLLTVGYRGTAFGSTCTVGIHPTDPKVLSVMCPSLDQAIDFGVPTHLGHRLYSLFEDPKDADHCLEVVTENLRIILRDFFNLTAANMTLDVKQRVSPVIRLLPRALPLMNLRGEPDIWTVLVG